MCVDTRFKNQNERFGVEPCIKDSPGSGGEQVRQIFSVNQSLLCMCATVDQVLAFWS